ncbi:MAG: sigma-70 family RNA polymerase sigma factor [Lachnospiraceae bacterium]|nr:sigma-70 family RNA polymerase sigma factor [Lachnospiraceae bacterium]
MSKKESKDKEISFIEDCYRLYEQKMYHVAYRILHDEGCAEDAVHEAFIRMMKKDVFFEDACSDDCKRYIIKVIKNVSINIYNKNKRKNEVIYLSDREDEIPYEDERLNSDDIDIREYISYLPDKYYDVVDCLINKNLSVKETAKELDITETNVRKRFERAKAMLRNMMKGEFEYDERKYRERNA